MQTKQPKKPTSPAVAITTLVVVGLIFWWLYGILTAPPEPRATSYQTTLGAYGALDPKTVKVQVGVKNTGQVAHAASCVLTVTSESGNYTGANVFETRLLQPDQQETYSVNVEVKDQGAAYITSGHAECEDK